MEEDLDSYLKTIYYSLDNAASYSSTSKLYQKVLADKKNITYSQIEKWLKSQTTYTDHKEVKKKFKTQTVYAPYSHYLWDIDTVNMLKYSKYNKFNYFLVCIDILSRFAYTFPLKTLQGGEMCLALKHIFKTQKPERIRSDKGSEMINKKVAKLLNNLNIIHFTTTSQFKACYAERFIKTLKSKISRYIYHKQNYKWDNILKSVTKSYNSTFHRSIHTTPENALNMTSQDLWLINYGPHSNKTKNLSNNQLKIKKKYKYKIGTKVKISYMKTVFQRAYSQTYTDEVFIISSRYAKENIPIYILKDWNNEIINGTFYESEISEVDVSDNTVYKIDKIIKTRIRNKRKECLISWKGWRKEFDSWVPAENIADYKDSI